jgi:hypothetical protein
MSLRSIITLLLGSMTVFLVLRVVRRSAEGADIAILAGPLTEAPSSSRVSFDDAVDDPAEFLDCCACLVKKTPVPSIFHSLSSPWIVGQALSCAAWSSGWAERAGPWVFRSCTPVSRFEREPRNGTAPSALSLSPSEPPAAQRVGEQVIAGLFYLPPSPRSRCRLTVASIEPRLEPIDPYGLLGFEAQKAGAD